MVEDKGNWRKGSSRRKEMASFEPVVADGQFDLRRG